MQKLYWLCGVFLFLASCSNDFSVKGKIDGMPISDFRLEELTQSGVNFIDSGKTNAQGEFFCKGSTNEEKLYKLQFQNNKYILLAINKNENINITSQWNKFDKYLLQGSESSALLKSFLDTFEQRLININTLYFVIDNLKKQPQSDSLIISAENDLKAENKNLTDFVTHYADTTKSIANAIFAIKFLQQNFDVAYLNSFYKKITTRFPNSNLAKEYATDFFELNKNSNPNEDLAPAFLGTTPNGNTISLADFKGKYVLIDFWASWCAPCRNENPNVVKAYELNKDKNFAIISISLDTDKEKWTQAIAKDKLTWNHISELNGWASAIARNYKVNNIPQNFLIDPNGNIIAKGLIGTDLIDKLNEVVK